MSSLSNGLAGNGEMALSVTISSLQRFNRAGELGICSSTTISPELRRLFLTERNPHAYTAPKTVEKVRVEARCKKYWE
jgi:hypothetical protein